MKLWLHIITIIFLKKSLKNGLDLLYTQLVEGYFDCCHIAHVSNIDKTIMSKDAWWKFSLHQSKTVDWTRVNGSRRRFPTQPQLFSPFPQPSCQYPSHLRGNEITEFYLLQTPIFSQEDWTNPVSRRSQADQAGDAQHPRETAEST